MTTTTSLAPGGYEAFAPFYDAFTAGSDYETWTRHMVELARSCDLAGNTLLDVACGTGKSFIPFVERGFKVTATDLSAAMLAEAASKAPEVALVQADMRELPALGRFDLITCFDDSLNHLLDERELSGSLRSMAANLAPDGLLLFDLNTLLAYRTTFAVDAVVEHDGIVFAWRGESSADAQPGCATATTIEVFVPGEGSGYERIRARHAQRHFPPHRVTALLARAGLECVGVHGVRDDGSAVPELDETTQLKVLYVARLAERR